MTYKQCYKLALAVSEDIAVIIKKRFPQLAYNIDSVEWKIAEVIMDAMDKQGEIEHEPYYGDPY